MKRVLLLTCLLFIHNGFAQEQNLDHWIKEQALVSRKILVSHISPHDGAKGSVIASPSKHDPDYYYHWVRDAALVMNILMEEFIEMKKLPGDLEFKPIEDYIRFSKFIQNQDAITGLGEPKFYVNGSSFNLPWGRPQNDGPALRSLYLIRVADYFITRDLHSYIQKELYQSELPAKSIIKKDLEYVALHWRDSSFDLWEEVNAQHFIP